MPNPEFTSYTPEYAKSLIYALESEASELAELGLASGTVTIAIDENNPVNNKLPYELQDIFVKIGNRATHVQSIGMNVSYDKVQHRFIPRTAAIKVNTGAIIDFGQSPLLAANGQYHMQIIDSAGIPLVVPPFKAQTDPFSLAELEEILQAVGLELPMGQQNADLSSVSRMLQFSKIWHAKFEKSIYISPQQSVRIKDEVAGGYADVDDDAFGHTAEEVWHRTLTIGIDESPANSLRPNTCLAATFTAKETYSVPRLLRFDRLPVSYKADNLDWVMGAVIEHPKLIRVEHFDNAQNIDIDAALLESFRQTMLTARLSIDSDTKLT